MADDPDDRSRPQRVDPDDIRRALEEQAKRRPPRPPAFDTTPPIPRLRVEKPRNRSRKKS